MKRKQIAQINKTRTNASHSTLQTNNTTIPRLVVGVFNTAQTGPEAAAGAGPILATIRSGRCKIKNCTEVAETKCNAKIRMLNNSQLSNIRGEIFHP